MKKILLLSLLSLSFCSDSNFRDVQGTLKSTSPTTFDVPASPAPAITILGRSPDEFEVEFAENTLGTSAATFSVRGVPVKQPVIFEVNQSALDPVVSFPYDLQTTSTITLPALESGTTAQIIEEVENVSGQSISPTTTGLILGQLNSAGSVGNSCDPITSVRIKHKETDQNAAVVGPFYFNNSGQVVNTNEFSDTQCNFVIANVLAGSYILEFLDSSLQLVKEQEVLSLNGQVSFGMDFE